MAQFCTAGALVFVCFSTLALARSDEKLLCTDQMCELYNNLSSCPKIPENCDEIGIRLPSASICNCCEHCLEYIDIGETCSIGSPDQVTATSICGPGLTCTVPTDGGFPSCQPMKQKHCIRKQLSYEDRRKKGRLMLTETRPRCDDRGDYASPHCIHGGLCYCVSKDGNRIFGEMPFISIDQAELMNCDCSKVAVKSALVGGKTTLTVRCDSSGSYEKFQCINDKCACVNRRNAALTSKVVGYDDLLELPCYVEDAWKMAEYFTTCELERRATLQEDAIGVRVQMCQPHGGYEPVRTIHNVTMCVAPNGTQIEHFQAAARSVDAKRMDCKCARARMMLHDHGISELPSCESYGNYEGLQCQRGKCYCVDPDGDQTKKEVQQSNVQQLSCYRTPSEK